MLQNQPAKWIVGALVAGAALPAMAETSQQSELAELRARVAQLEAKEQEGWLNERRAEEVKSLVREVLADADTRASLLQEGVMAGISDKGKIFLQSADGSFRLNVGGQIQFRWIFNYQDEDSADNSDTAGFQVRRTKLIFDGHIADPKLTYKIVLAGDREDGAVEVEDVIVGYKMDNGLSISFGKFKIPFLHEELVSSTKQLAVERGIVTEFFTLDRSEQVQLGYSTDMFKAAVSLNDGADEEFSTIGDDPVEIAIAGRVDVKLAGDWKQFDDYSSQPGDDMGIRVGAAAFYSAGEGDIAGGSSPSDANYFAWTIDGQVEVGGLGVSGAFIGGHIDPDGDGEDRDMFGASIQAGYAITKELEPFGRFEWLDDDADATDDLIALTVGANYYFKGHNAKWTNDVVIILDGSVEGNPFGNTAVGDGLGFAGFGSAEDDIALAFRSQFQLLF